MTSPPLSGEPIDLLIVGGGINGVGIARDAAGRGLSVQLVEREDLASHTSSASTKLIHGGLRYLEFGEFRLVHESLIERERLLGIAPHLIHPLDFVLPQTHSPRPAWVVRAGLFLYDHLGGRKSLPPTRTLDLASAPEGRGLKPAATGRAFEYADCRVDDARLVVLNAMDAAERGARIATRTTLQSARRDGTLWHAVISGNGAERSVCARAIVNAGGPWVDDVLGRIAGAPHDRLVRLVKGSHIIVPRLYDGDHAFLLQNPDRRVVFAIPYEGAFTLIGTTDQPWEGPPGHAHIDDSETAYLCETINRYFVRQISPADVVWSYAGIRPLYDDHAANASAVTRDYVLHLEAPTAQAPVLSIYGGKITTFRRLAEHALAKLAPFFSQATGPWTASAPLPGGDLPAGGFDVFLDELLAAHPDWPKTLLRRLAHSYGTRLAAILGSATTPAELGDDLGGGLSEAELCYLVEHEWARTAEDVLWRRSKLGLHTAAETAERVKEWLVRNAIG